MYAQKRSTPNPIRVVSTATMAVLALVLAVVAPAAAGTRAAQRAVPPADTALAEDAERHCVAFAQTDQRVAEAAEPLCWADAADAAAFVEAATSDRVGGTGLSRAGGNNVIGRHYDGTSYSGSSLTIVGTTCAGGVWVASGWWNNRISSSGHYCGSKATRFYNSSSCSGSSKSIFSWTSSLGWMNNKTSCVRYG